MAPYRRKGTCRPSIVVLSGLIAIVLMTVVGCGATMRGALRVVRPDGIRGRIVRHGEDRALKYVTLARERVAGGHISFFGIKYNYLGHNYFGLSVRKETAHSRGRFQAGGSGTALREGQGYGISLVQVEDGCLGRFQSRTAYGLLRNTVDNVVAEQGQRKVIFKKVSLPGDAHVSGALVYTSLGPGRVDIVTRASDGAVLTHESYGEERAACS